MIQLHHSIRKKQDKMLPLILHIICLLTCSKEKTFVIGWLSWKDSAETPQHSKIYCSARSMHIAWSWKKFILVKVKLETNTSKETKRPNYSMSRVCTWKPKKLPSQLSMSISGVQATSGGIGKSSTFFKAVIAAFTWTIPEIQKWVL